MAILLLSMCLLHLLPSDVLWESNKNRPIDLNQNDYQLKFEHFDVVRYNKDYIQEFSLYIFKFNRTCSALNTSMITKTDFENDIEVVVQTYKFASNEYRLFPIRFQFNFCDVINKHVFGLLEMRKCGNFRSCPFRKGIRYYVCNFVPNQNEFPPFIPTGRYKVVVQFFQSQVDLGLGELHIEIARPFDWRKHM